MNDEWDHLWYINKRLRKVKIWSSEEYFCLCSFVSPSAGTYEHNGVKDFNPSSLEYKSQQLVNKISIFPLSLLACILCVSLGVLSLRAFFMFPRDTSTAVVFICVCACVCLFFYICGIPNWKFHVLCGVWPSLWGQNFGPHTLILRWKLKFGKAWVRVHKWMEVNVKAPQRQLYKCECVCVCVSIPSSQLGKVGAGREVWNVWPSAQSWFVGM